jgi:PPOX class probable F420-dependent enzyme
MASAADRGGELLDQARTYLSQPRCAVLSSLGRDGAPHQAVVHYMLLGDHLLVNGRPDRVWASNLRRDPRASLVIHDTDDPLHWVGIRGVAELAAEGEAAVHDAMTLATRYGEDPADYRDQERVSFRIAPRRVFEYGRPGASGPEHDGGSKRVTVREATAADWEAIWPFMRKIVAAGETFSWDADIDENAARDAWMHEPPGRTFVAVDEDGRIIGTAELEPNHGGPAAHVATASFMVDPARSRRGAGRALGERVLEQARGDGYRAMQFNAVVETNTAAVALWRSLGFEVLATVPQAFNHPTGGYVGLHIMYRPL